MKHIICSVRAPALASDPAAVPAASMRRLLRWCGLSVLSANLLAACVTINIYFPAAAAEKAADRIIEEVYQLRKDAPAAKPAESR